MTSDEKIAGPPPRLRALLWRGLKKKCPHCGGGNVFRGWIKMHDACSACGLRFLGNQGDLMAYLVVVDRGVFIFPLIALIYIRLYKDYSAAFYVSVCVGLIVAFFVTLPVRNSLGLALDYLARRKWGDLSEADKASMREYEKH